MPNKFLRDNPPMDGSPDSFSDDDAHLEGESNLDIQGNEEDWTGDEAREEIRIEKDQYSLLHIKRLAEVRKELIISPAFQRNDVWNTRQKSELIESILMGIPLPVVYLFESKEGSKQVVDGRQRISAILEFLNDKLTLGNLKILPQFSSLKFSQLPPITQGIFEDFQLQCYVIQPPTPERIKYNIFDRVNRGGTKLNSQEMRNALYSGISTEILTEICDSPEFIKATDSSISRKRMRDRYAALRCVAFHLLFTDSLGPDEAGIPISYRSDMDDFLAKTMTGLNRNYSRHDAEAIASNIREAMMEIYLTLGSDAFRFYSFTRQKRAINMPLMEALVFLFMLDWHRPAIDRIKGIIEDFKKEADFEGTFRTRVDSSVSVKRRFRQMVILARQLDPEFSYRTEVFN